MYYSEGLILSLISVFTLISILFIKTIFPIFKFLGAISFSLYLTHTRVGGRVLNLTESLTNNLLVRQFAVFVALAISLIFAWLFYHFIEKYFKQKASTISYKTEL